MVALAADDGEGHVDIWATCSAGLEDIAAGEVSERLAPTTGVQIAEGHLRFLVPIARIDDLQRLRCVERLWAVVAESCNLLTGDEASAEDDLCALSKMATGCAWEQPLRTWSRFCPALAESIGHQLAAAGVHEFSSSACDADVDPPAMRFRSTCHRAGPAPGQVSAQHGFSSLEAAASFGGAIRARHGWTVGLAKGCFDIDVRLHIHGRAACAMLKLTATGGNSSGAAKPPQRHGGAALSRTALRPSVAAALTRLRLGPRQRFPAAELVVDPMCGGGTLGMEVAAGWSNTYVVNGDVGSKEVDRFVHNRERLCQPLACDEETANTAPGQLEGLLWDASRLPLRTAVADTIVTDLPWGKGVGTREANQSLYPAALREIARVLSPGGVALLLTKDTKLMNRVLDAAWALESFVQHRGAPRIVMVGGMRAALYGLERSATSWAALQGQAEGPCDPCTEGTKVPDPIAMPSHAELRKVESLIAELAAGRATKNQRRKLNQQAHDIRTSAQYLAEAAAMGRSIPCV